jgi:hypothetical protein
MQMAMAKTNGELGIVFGTFTDRSGNEDIFNEAWRCWPVATG